MKNLILFELRKLSKNKSFYICLTVTAVIIVLNALMNKSFADAAGNSISPDSFVIAFTSNGMIGMILGIFTSIFATDDYSSGTIKNIYAKGYSRNEVYLSKYLVSTFSAFIFLSVSYISSLIISRFLFNGTAEENSTMGISVFMEFLLIIAYNSLFFIISMSLEKLGTSIAFSILGPSVISLLLSLVDSFLKLKDFSFSSYWLDSCLSSVQVANVSQSVIISSLTISVIVIAASIFVGLKLNSKKEF